MSSNNNICKVVDETEWVHTTKQCKYDETEFGEYAVERGYCVRGREGSVRDKLRALLDRQPPNSDEPNSFYVQELLHVGAPRGASFEWEHAFTSPSMLSEGGVYRIGEWSVCLMEKSLKKLIFKSIEKHFEIGHLQFTIGLELVKKRVVGMDCVFEREDDAIEFLTQDDDDDGSEESSDGSETMEAGYWDDLFETQVGDATEWLVSYDTISAHVEPYLEASKKILVVGCGNSDLSTGLYSDGYRHVTSMDISPVVILQMKEKFGDHSEMQWHVEDVLEMSYPDNSFDVVVDKSLLDCSFHCGNHGEKVAGMLAELHRVLKKGSGIAIFLTTQGPEQVMPFLEDSGCGTWSTEQAYVTVTVDCEGRVPKNATSVLNDEMTDEEFSKSFQFYFCHALQSDNSPCEQ
mmetsp:Transcript_36141/g.60916  ORF Transcript_36141/g.60916 Transcript_36141/m.60916 type:complete len:404 (-) Transcript_36141:307-1518(-)